jgi:hypothetical protein
MNSKIKNIACFDKAVLDNTSYTTSDVILGICAFDLTSPNIYDLSFGTIITLKKNHILP